MSEGAEKEEWFQVTFENSLFASRHARPERRPRFQPRIGLLCSPPPLFQRLRINAPERSCQPIPQEACTSRRPFARPPRSPPFGCARYGVVVPGLPLRLRSRTRCPARSTHSSQPLPVFPGRGCSTLHARCRTLWFAIPSPRPPCAPLRDLSLGIDATGGAGSGSLP
jgi:hypothetical protein